MQSITILLCLLITPHATLAVLREIFPRYSVAKGAFDEESLANLYDRGSVVNEADLNATCNDNGCSAEFSHSFNFNAARASGVKLTLENNGLQNSTIVLSVAEPSYTIKLDYIYTIYPAYLFVGWASYNYEEDNYNQCMNQPNWYDMINARHEPIRSYTDTYRRYQIVTSQAKRIDYSAWGHTATSVCNHHWATNYVMCERRSLVVDYAQGIAVFSIAPESELSMTMNLAINDDVENFVVQPSIDVPFEIDLDKITFSVSPAGTIISPLAGKYYLARFQREDMFSNINVTNWYKANTMPTISSVTETATKYHSYQLFPPIAYEPDTGKYLPFYNDPNDMKFMNVVKCGSGYVNEKAVRTPTQRRIDALRAQTATDDLLDRTNLDSLLEFLAVFNNPYPKDSLSYFPDPLDEYSNFTSRRDQDCCVPITTASRNYLETYLKSYDLVSKRDGQYEIELPDTLDRSPGNVYPAPVVMNSHNLLKVSLSGVISSNNLRIPYGAADGSVSSASISMMQIATASTGSYFNYEIDYVGLPNLIPITSKSLYLLKKTISVTGTGTFKGSVAFQSPKDPGTSRTICFGSNNICVEPKTVDFLAPPEGAVQDPDTTDCAGVTPSFFSILLSNIGLFAIAIIMIILDIIIGVAVLLVIIRTVPKIFVLLMVLFTAKDVNALSYTASPLQNLSAIPIRDLARFTYSEVYPIAYSDVSIPAPIEQDPTDPLISEFYTQNARVFSICHDFVNPTTSFLPKDIDTMSKVKFQLGWYTYVYNISAVRYQLSLPAYLPAMQPSSLLDTTLYTRVSVNNVFVQEVNYSFQDPIFIYAFDSPVTATKGKDTYSVLAIATTYNDMVQCPSVTGVTGKSTRLFLIVPNSTTYSEAPIVLSDKQIYVAKSTYRVIDFASRDPITYTGLASVLQRLYTGNIDANTFICNGPNVTLFRATTVLSCDGACVSKSQRSAISKVAYKHDARTQIGNIFFHTHNAYYTRQGVYVPSLIGPLQATPYYSGNCTVSVDSNGALLLMDYEPPSVEYTHFKFDDVSYKSSVSKDSFTFKPTLTTCTGSTWISDDNALLTCNNDCCLSTFDDYQSFNLLQTGDVIRIPHSSDALPFAQYMPTGNQRNFFCPASGCSFNTMQQVYECALDKHPASTVMLFYFIPIFIGFYLLIIVVRYTLKGFAYGFQSVKFLNPKFYADKIVAPTKTFTKRIIQKPLRFKYTKNA